MSQELKYGYACWMRERLGQIREAVLLVGECLFL